MKLTTYSHPPISARVVVGEKPCCVSPSRRAGQGTPKSNLLTSNGSLSPLFLSLLIHATGVLIPTSRWLGGGNGKKQEEQRGGKHALKGPGTAGDGGPGPKPQALVKTSLQVIKPLSLKQENLRCRGRRGAPGSRGLARGGGPCPAVCSLACCVLCALLCWAFCAACAHCPALPSLPFCPSSPLPLGPQPQPPGVHESAGGMLPCVHGLPVCFRTE